jgi:Cd2+/Zn2+-exporting ATPase
MNMSHPSLPAGQSLLKLETNVVLPGVDEGDACLERLVKTLRDQKGVAEAHIHEQKLCLHYDPNLISLEHLQKLGQEAGAEILKRYDHRLLSIEGLGQGTNVSHIESALKKLPGVTHVAVSYAARTLKVEFDSTRTKLSEVLTGVRKLGYKVTDKEYHDYYSDHEGHDHKAHAGHNHGPVDPNASWFVRHRDVVLSMLCGILGLTAYFGQGQFGLPASGRTGLYVAAYIAGAYELAGHTLPTILRGKFDVEFLMLVAALGAAALGQWPEGTLLLFLFSIGHALEGFAMDRARKAIEALGSVTPKTARVRRDDKEIEVNVGELQVGDMALVRPGDRIAVEGVIANGSSAVDQSPITGESVPVEKNTGDNVFAGSINGDGSLEVEVKKLAKDTTMARVIKMVEEAQTQKSPTQTFTDKFERILVPTVLVVVVIAAVAPPLLGWLPWKIAISRALSTLVGASPCALALATPSAVLAGIAQAARNGVLIKGGVHLENLGLLSAIALDKTGTITRGKPEVTDVFACEGFFEKELLRLAASVETRSSHPLAQAVVACARQDNLELASAGDLKNLQGRGVESQVEGQKIRIGNRKMFDEAGLAITSELEEKLNRFSESGKPIMIIGVDDRVAGLLAMADQIRTETPKALQALRKAGVQSLIMLTGDNARVAKSIAEAAGVTEVKADLLPEQKVEAIQELLKKYGMVAMVGDGVNDAPALANATVGIAMGSGGTDVALETADVALMGDDLAKLPFAVALSRQSRSIIRQNLFISLAVIGLLIPSTLFGYTGIGLAVFFHEGSTLLVVFNALRLLAFK